MARVIRADRRGPAVVPAAIVNAEDRAQARLRDAEAEAERLCEQARVRGAEAASEELAHELVRLARAHEQAVAALEPQLIEIALQAAKSLVRAELQARPEQVQAIVSPLLERLRRARRLRIRVHPDDRAALEPCMQALRERDPRPLELAIETDPQLSRGGCVVQSEIGTLDARVETQLAALARALGAP